MKQVYKLGSFKKTQCWTSEFSRGKTRQGTNGNMSAPEPSPDADREFLCAHFLRVNHVPLFVNKCAADIWQHGSPFTKPKHSSPLRSAGQPAPFLWGLVLHFTSMWFLLAAGRQSAQSLMHTHGSYREPFIPIQLNRIFLHAGNALLFIGWPWKRRWKDVLNLMEHQWWD